jgi:hypothetical protein
LCVSSKLFLWARRLAVSGLEQDPKPSLRSHALGSIVLKSNY